jgi:hypothetical protein
VSSLGRFLRSLDTGLPFFFGLIALPTLVIFATLVPYGGVADEPAQSMRAQAILNGEFVGHRVTIVTPDHEIQTHAGVDADPALLFAAITPHGFDLTVPAASLSKAHQQSWTGHPVFMEISPLAVYAPVFYLPGAAGLAAAHWLGFSPYHAALLGRLCNAVTYLVLGTLALCLARRARAIMFGVLTVPIAFNLAGSLSQDGLIIATSVLAAACLSRAYEEPQRDLRYRAGAALALLAVAIVKPPYLILALGLLPPLPWPLRGRAARGVLLSRAAIIAAIALPVIAWFGWTMVHVSAPTYFAPRPVGPLLAGPHPALLDHTDPLLQIHALLQAPWRIVTLPFHSFYINPLWRELVGKLGWIDLILPDFMYNMWAAAAVLAACAALAGPALPAATPRLGVTGSLTLVFAVIATFLAIYLSQYLVWTTVGATQIDGPQGRYLLPLLPFLGLALPKYRFAYGSQVAGLLSLGVIVSAMAGLCVLPYILATAYYLN